MKGVDKLITSLMTKFIDLVPERLVITIGKKVINRRVNKNANIKIYDMENLQGMNKPVIFICNHLSNSDGLILNKLLKEQELTFVAGVKLSNNPITKIGLEMMKTIPIKPNSADKDAMTKIISSVKHGNNILIFPEGTRSRVGSMIKAKKGILLIAKLTKATIIPLGLWGTEQLLPICSEDMSKEKFQPADVHLKIGKPITLPSKEKDESKAIYEERAINHLMKSIAELLPEKYRGEYK